MFGVQGSFNACTKWDLMYTWCIKQGCNTYHLKKWTMEYWMSFGMILPFFKFITKYLDFWKYFLIVLFTHLMRRYWESAQHRYVKLQQMSYKIPNGSQILIWGQRNPTFPTPQGRHFYEIIFHSTYCECIQLYV